MALDGNPVQALKATGRCTWSSDWDSAQVADGTYVLSVIATAPASPDYENAPGEWPEKHILGTELGPNENGHRWPSRRARKPTTR